MAAIVCKSGPESDWRIDIAGRQFGLVEWKTGTSTIYVYRPVGTVPLSPPSFMLLQLVGLVLILHAYFRFESRRWRVRKGTT